MSPGESGFIHQYRLCLEKYLDHGGEAPLSRAYELGRRALREGLGVLDMATAHQDALEAILLSSSAAEQPRLARAAADFFREVLSPFEMTFRGHREASELERLNAELMQQKEALEAVNRELEAFGDSVSHDLRAPLRRIDGFTDALVEDYAEALNARGKDYLQHIHESTRHMAQLIDGLLALSRVARGDIHRDRVDLSNLARRIAESLKATDPARRVDLVVHDDVVAEGDPDLLEMVLENLLTNAWKFTAKREPARIEFGQRHEGGQRVYFVRDNGAGFDMAYKDKLFRWFQRLHSPEEFEGTGIGLATVRRVVHRHGGRVWAEAEVGRGATFYFALRQSP